MAEVTELRSTKNPYNNGKFETKDDAGWMEWYELLKQYKRNTGHLIISNFRCYKGKQLGGWVSRQRHQYKIGRLKEDRIEKLNAVGFVWSFGKEKSWKKGRKTKLYDQRWERMYKQLLKFKEENGHIHVKRHLVEVEGKEYNLGWWVCQQKMHLRAGTGGFTLTRDRKKRLAELGIHATFDRNKDSIWQKAWDGMFDLLVEFKREHGHIRVPRVKSTPVKKWQGLSKWVKFQQQMLAHNRMHPDRLERLINIGFCFKNIEHKDDGWGEMFNHLSNFRQTYGHTRVPSFYKTKDGKDLGLFVVQQRELFNSGILNTERTRRLSEELNFEFPDLRKRPWKFNYLRLRAFQEEFGHCNVPEDYDDGGNLRAQSLRSFVDDQNREGHNGTLPDHKIRKLDKLGFLWLRPPASA